MFDSFVAKEGKKAIISSFILVIFFYLIGCSFMTFVSFVALLFFIYIFRLKFVNLTNLNDNELYAPISGKVISIDRDGFNKVITIEVGFFDTHSLRSLENGKVEVSHKRGINLPLGSLKARLLNERTTIKFKNSTMQIYHSACNLLAIEKKDKLKKGEILGTFLKGEVTIKVTKNIELAVNIGDKVQSGETLLATLKKA
ncbi:phosphatidylserine decarboxylase [Halarcobacter ebronensis]|uniref:Phosphatidylserine decarboxylase n=1 Tax=Halarcobacter ebronensis TaxID=1462615 RepID=A0A4Q1AN46_9BACT|nr:phosphatidylserine decarboxylase [Halarcobacter ebronensis]QKF81156.1 hypothetical protein AEBR_0648 [Halarcobacter ebronensis]RXK03269.1 hypothetical protein CRV07_12825 [Halarcobacter ebronensis]